MGGIREKGKMLAKGRAKAVKRLNLQRTRARRGNAPGHHTSAVQVGGEYKRLAFNPGHESLCRTREKRRVSGAAQQQSPPYITTTVTAAPFERTLVSGCNGRTGSPVN